MMIVCECMLGVFTIRQFSTTFLLSVIFSSSFFEWAFPTHSLFHSFYDSMNSIHKQIFFPENLRFFHNCCCWCCCVYSIEPFKFNWTYSLFVSTTIVRRIVESHQISYFKSHIYKAAKASPRRRKKRTRQNR